MARLKSGTWQHWIKNEEYEQLVNLAMEAYHEMPCSEKGRLLVCAQRFGIPKSTLSACLNGWLSKLESAKLCQKLFPEEEQVLIQYLKDAAHWGFPDTWEWCKRRATEILRTQSMGLEHPVSSSWLDQSLDCHGTSICTFWSKTHSSVQGGALNESVVNHWFQLLEETVTKFPIVCRVCMDGALQGIITEMHHLQG